jgi:hypothetical protein
MNMLRITQINYENPYKMKIILNSPTDFQFNPMFPDSWSEIGHHFKHRFHHLFQKDNAPAYASRDAETWKHFDIIFLEYCSM